MSSISPKQETAPPVTVESKKSVQAITGLLVLCGIAVLFPAAPFQLLHGLLFLGAGGLLIFLPPRVALPRGIYFLAGATLLLGLTAFLPMSWFPQPEWRRDLEALGLTTGPFQTPHPRQSIEKWMGWSLALLVALYGLGHRISDRLHLLTLWCVSLVVAIYAALAMGNDLAGWKLPWDTDSSFGFFPNRNHTATLLVMGTLPALGCLMQSIRQKRNILAGLSALTLAVIQLAVWGFSPSRAGAILTVLFVTAWIIGLGRKYRSRQLLLGLIGGGGIGAALFLMTNGDLKKRLHESVAPPPLGAASPATSLEQHTSETHNVRLDFRLRIFQDALTLIADAPWTGVGLGNFRYIFPQYRQKSTSSSRAIHPESDWLLVAAESGWPTALALAGTVGWLFVLVFQAARNRPLWVLRWTSILTAAVVPVHGLFDVPGHRIGLSWLAFGLLGLSLRETSTSVRTGRSSQIVFRSLGGIAAATGLLLLAAEGFSRPAITRVRTAQLEAAAQALADADASERAAAPPGTAPLSIPSAEDKLEQAMAVLDQAIAREPLEPELHLKKGFIALHFSDQQAIVEKEFALERRLEPQWVMAPLRQAHEWALLNPAQAEALWVEAFRRSAAMDSLAKGQELNPFQIRERILADLRGSDDLSERALKYFLPDPEMLVAWANQASPALLNRVAPDMLTAKEVAPETRRKLVAIWIARGDRKAAEKWVEAHPELR